jgi:hypothetical protein
MRLTFSGVTLLGFCRTQTRSKADFSSSLSQAVMKTMGWSDVPEWLTGAQPEGDLSATALELVPKEQELRKHAMELDISRLFKFEIVRLELEGKQGKGHRLELRFTAVFNDPAGARKLEEFMAVIGEGKCSLTVSYTKQEVLPGVEATQEQMEAVGAAND